jgi:hypothetical protein
MQTFKRAAVVALASCLLLASGCRSRQPTVESADTSSEGSSVESRAAAPVAESAGLVGPGMGDVERIVVTDEGPAGAAIFITAGLKGYTEPCGCTLDLVLGGIDRVSGFVLEAGALATSSLVLDAGNTLFEHAELHPSSLAQEVRKTEVIAAALRAMGTAATVPGPTDLANGAEFYRSTMAAAGVAILAANLSTSDELPFADSTLLRPLGMEVVGIIGVVDPALFAEIEGLRATEPRPHVERLRDQLRSEGATTLLVLFHGALPAARQHFADIEGIDFIVLGNAPRKTDEIEQIGSAVTLEAYDQGRYVGRLKLVRAETGDATSPWASARSGSSEEVAQIEQIIAGLQERIAALPQPAPGEPEPPILTAQRNRIAEYEAQLTAMRSGGLDFTTSSRTFLWTPTPMEPGYQTLDAISESMVQYNRDLAEIASRVVEEVPALAEGQPGYVGGERCATCHVEEHAFWLTTQHAQAWETLEQRDKHFDRNCIGCHVTGYRQPGGAVLGHLDGLQDVQCEQCHGPGSLHVANPLLNIVPGGVMTQVTEATCASGCHVPEHSPRFEFESYLQRIIGPGHGAP